MNTMENKFEKDASDYKSMVLFDEYLTAKLAKEEEDQKYNKNRIVGVQVAKAIKYISEDKEDFLYRSTFLKSEGDYLAFMVETPMNRDEFMALWMESHKFKFKIWSTHYHQDTRWVCKPTAQENCYIIYGKVDWTDFVSLEKRQVSPFLYIGKGKKKVQFNPDVSFQILPKKAAKTICPIDMYLATDDYINGGQPEEAELYLRKGIGEMDKYEVIYLWFNCKNTFHMSVVDNYMVETEFRIYDEHGELKLRKQGSSLNFGDTISFFASPGISDWADGHYTAKAYVWGTLIADCTFYVGQTMVGKTVMNDYTRLTDVKKASKKKTMGVKSVKTGTKAIELIRQMVGLNEVKKLVEQNIHYVKLMEERKKVGLPAGNRLMHVVMSGAPGTGKTTVARLLGAAYKEMGILSKGHTVECNRASLVSDHIGGTEKTTQEKIAEAKGGVLFIDEAYSLLSESPTSSDFGCRIIDTLMTMLSDPNPDTLVVMAGYKEEMQKLLDSNPGLASRFPVRLNFPSYSVDELMSMVIEYFNVHQYDASEEVMQRIRSVIDYASKVKSFGEGRFVRTFIENMILPNMATRLFTDTYDGMVDKVDLIRILPQDVPEPEKITVRIKEPEKKIRAIGFR